MTGNAYLISPTVRQTSSIVSRACSSCSLVCVAMTLSRNMVLAGAPAGGTIAFTKIPRS